MAKKTQCSHQTLGMHLTHDIGQCLPSKYCSVQLHGRLMRTILYLPCRLLSTCADWHDWTRAHELIRQARFPILGASYQLLFRDSWLGLCKA
jgi:hypothetical protein